MPADPILAKGHIRFIEARFPAVAASQLDITRRLTDHLWKLREAQERRLAEAAAPLRQEDAAQPAVGTGRVKVVGAEGGKGNDLLLPPSVEAIVAALERPDTRAGRLNLRSVIRLLDRAAELERDPMPV